MSVTAKIVTVYVCCGFIGAAIGYAFGVSWHSFALSLINGIFAGVLVTNIKSDS